MPRKRLTTSVPAKASKKNKAGDIGVTSSGNYKVWTGDGWSGNYESQTGAIDYMKTLHGDIGPRLVEARKRGGTFEKRPIGPPGMGFFHGYKEKGKPHQRGQRQKSFLLKKRRADRENFLADMGFSVKGFTKEFEEWRKQKKRDRAAKQTPPTQAKSGGKVSRKSGGKIMYGYKAGGRV